MQGQGVLVGATEEFCLLRASAQANPGGTGYVQTRQMNFSLCDQVPPKPSSAVTHTVEKLRSGGRVMPHGRSGKPWKSGLMLGNPCDCSLEQHRQLHSVPASAPWERAQLNTCQCVCTHHAQHIHLYTHASLHSHITPELRATLRHTRAHTCTTPFTHPGTHIHSCTHA